MFFRKFKPSDSSNNAQNIRDTILDFLLKSKTVRGDVSTSMADNTNLIDDLGMDSIDVVELILYLEKQYQIDFDQAKDIPRLDTIGGITNAVLQQLKTSQ